jgi:hypothetical protein
MRKFGSGDKHTGSATLLKSNFLRISLTELYHVPAGVLKFATLGFFFIGHLVDVVLIATQTLGPADNSSYVINYFGAGP